MRSIEILKPAQRRPSKAYLANEFRKAVFTWREQNYPGITPTTKRLLQFWFEEDHIIIGDGKYFSFADDGLIEKYIHNYSNMKKGIDV